MWGFSFSKMTMIPKDQKPFSRPSAEFFKGGGVDWRVKFWSKLKNKVGTGNHNEPFFSLRMTSTA